MRAELFSLTGASNKAISAAQELLKDRGLTILAKCRLREALGLSYFRTGSYRAGAEEYEQGIRLAEANTANLAACELRVGLFRNKIMWIGPYQAAAEVNQLRRRVHHAANPGLAIKFQVGLVELAAKLGLLRKARRHLNIARELQATVDDRALVATIGLTEVALTAAEGDLGRALELSLDLIEVAEESGSASPMLALMNNLGHLLSAQARYSEAHRWINNALETRRLGGGTEVALRDTLMLLHVSKGDFGEADNEAKRISALLESPSEQDSFFGLWHVSVFSRKGPWLFKTLPP